MNVRGIARRAGVAAGLLALVAAVIAVPPGHDAAASAGEYVGLLPARIVDTRPGYATADGRDSGIGTRTPRSTTEVQIAGRVGVPIDAIAVVLRVAVVDASESGFVTVFPCGTTRPLAANLTHLDLGDTRSNAVVAGIGAAGTVCVFTWSAVDLVVDVSGYVPAGST